MTDLIRPTVSVVIPAYKHAAYIAQAIDSVLAQTFRDFELIVVNDGSPDNTAEVVKPYVESGQVTRYIEQANAGQAAARNRGIAAARGRYIALLDDDDWWPADKLQWQVAALEPSSGAALVYGDALTHDGKRDRLHQRAIAPDVNVRRTFLLKNRILSPGQALISSEAMTKVGGFDPALWGADDWDLYLRLAQVGRFLYQPRLALHYRWHPGNASQDVTRMYRNARRVLRQHLGWCPRWGDWSLAYAAHRHLRRWTAEQYVSRGHSLVAQGRRSDARREFFQAVKLHPPLLCRRDLLAHLLR